METMSMLHGAEILLVSKSGSLILQQRDKIHGIIYPGKIGTFGGHIEPNETAHHAALRELKEETNIELDPSDLEFMKTFDEYDPESKQSGHVHCYKLEGVDDKHLRVFEGRGYVLLHHPGEMTELNLAPITKQALEYYFSTKD